MESQHGDDGHNPNDDVRRVKRKASSNSVTFKVRKLYLVTFNWLAHGPALEVTAKLTFLSIDFYENSITFCLKHMLFLCISNTR